MVDGGRWKMNDALLRNKDKDKDKEQDGYDSSFPLELPLQIRYLQIRYLLIDLFWFPT